MGLLDRPYAPTWKQNRSVYRHVPDALVYINGATSLDACPTCNRQIELQKYITSVSVDSSTDPIATASISLVVPKHETDVFGSDGNWLLQPGLEIQVLFRGYFDESGLVKEDGLGDVRMYPYYQVFRGVVKDVSHDFSGGFYSATLSCADILHFWQNLYLSTNGAVFGPRPDNSGVFVDLEGHSLMRLSPFSIIYTLVRAGFGAAFGVEYKLSQKTNFTDVKGKAFKHAAEYWASRWGQSAGNLRMYGVDGSLFSMFEQAYLGLFQSGSPNKVKNIIKSIGGKINTNTKNLQSTSDFQKTMRELGYDRARTTSSVLASANGKQTRIDMLKMMVYANDLGTMGQVNFFNSDMMSKLEIANAVIALTGFEFYQDVDGDLVFKPPFYNLDTRQDPVYVIEDADLISINESSTEPEATMIKGTGVHFENWKGMATDDWMGVGSTYVDFRLVAQFGWKEGGAFETAYLTDPRAVFITAINRLDLANIGMNSATISIPLRPELRAGYPVYIRHLDCFYYAKSISHSFSFGGQCTTSINGVARRRKWFPPVDAPKDGKYPDLSDVKLDEPGKYPAEPLFVNPKNIGDGNEISGPTRMIGFPNVILALDAKKLDIGTIPLQALTEADLDNLVLQSAGALEKHSENLYFLKSGSGPNQGKEISKDELLQIFTGIRQELVSPSVQSKSNKKNKNQTNLSAFDSNLVRIFQNSTLGNNSAIRNDRELSSWISLNVNLKAVFAPGNELRGQYRYYSSNHSLGEFQGPQTLVINPDSKITYEDATSDFVTGTMIPTLTSVGDGVGVKMRQPKRGVRIGQDGATGLSYVDVLTGDVRQVSFAPHYNNTPTTQEIAENAKAYAGGLGISPATLAKAISERISVITNKERPNEIIKNRFNKGYLTVYAYFTEFYRSFTDARVGLSDVQITGPKNTPVAGQSKTPYSLVYAELGNLEKMLGACVIDGNVPVTDLRLYKNRDAFGVGKIADKLAGPMANVASQMMTSAKDLVRDGTEAQIVVSLYEAKIAFERSLGINSAIPKGLKKTKVTKASSKKLYTPVFPVSDENGFEVYGGMPYGRGMTLTQQYDIFTTTELDAAPEGMFNTERALVVIKNRGRDTVNSYNGLSENERNVLRAVGISSEGALNAFVEKRKEIQDLVLARNRPITTTDLYQATYGDSAAEQLANIGLTNEGQCGCKGADAAFLLEAYSRQEELVGENSLQEWTQEQVLEVGNLWAQSKNALAGVSGNQPFNYEAAGERIKNTLKTTSNSLKNIEERASEAKKRLKDRI
jgi:hypothetical protein